MDLVAQLRDQHRAIEQDAAQFLRIVDRAVADPAAVAALRWRLVRALAVHCTLEDGAIYDRIFASGDPAAIAVAQRLRQSHETLCAAVRAFAFDWSVERIAGEWSAFQHEARTLLAALAERLGEEEATLYPHIERILTRAAA